MYSGKNELSRKTNGNESLSPTTEAKPRQVRTTAAVVTGITWLGRERPTAQTNIRANLVKYEKKKATNMN